jgi:3-oxoacyl-[acyl-carrier-protein] synthase II
MSEVVITGGATVLDGDLESRLDTLPEAVRTRALRAERVTQLALAAAGGALSGPELLVVDGPTRPDAGVALGTAFGCLLTNATYQRRVARDGPRAASPRLFAATVSNAAAGEVGIGYRLGGPAVTLTAGAAAGLLAIGHAADLIAGGRARVMVAGGMDASGPALERWLADGGLPAGEAPVRGAAVLVVLQPGETTAADGARRIGRILGHGAGFAPPDDRDGSGVSAAIRQALAGADLPAADLAQVLLEGVAAVAEPAQRALHATLGSAAAARVRPPRGDAERFAAAGPRVVLEALADVAVDGPFLVLHACSSGHVAALIAERAVGP